MYLRERMMKEDLGKWTLDITAIGVAWATVANLLPALAALFTIVWTGIRIWETDTVKKLTGRGR